MTAAELIDQWVVWVLRYRALEFFGGMFTSGGIPLELTPREDCPTREIPPAWSLHRVGDAVVVLDWRDEVRSG